MTHTLKVFLKALIVSIRVVSLMEKDMATHSSILAWRIPWTEDPGRLQSTGVRESDMTERLYFYFTFTLGKQHEKQTNELNYP